jgi:hypothetical protein
VGAYYGCYMYSRARGMSRAHSDAMHLLFAMEVQAAEVYWHMKDDSVYEQLFSANRMAGKCDLCQLPVISACCMIDCVHSSSLRV